MVTRLLARFFGYLSRSIASPTATSPAVKTRACTPRSRKAFREFSLLAEGFCFFCADIVVSGAVRRIPMQGSVTVNNSEAYGAACLAGLGLINSPDADLSTGRHVEAFVTFGSFNLARPKSSTFACPPGVSLTFAGFRSR